MLLDTLKEEDSISLAGDDLMKTLNEIAQKSATERPLMDCQAIFHSPLIGKIEKEKLNSKERRSSQQIQFVEKEALQCRANSLKRAMHNIVDYSKQLKEKRYSMHCENMCVFTSSSSDTSPWSSPVPPINIISPSVSTTQLTCLSPLPDFRIDSVDEYFFYSLNLPVPKQFADSRRSSGVSENVVQDEKGSRSSVASSTSLTTTTTTTAIKIDENMEIFQLCKNQDKTSSVPTTSDSSDLNFSRIGYLAYSETEQRDDGFGFMPFEVYERNLLRTQSSAVAAAVASSSSSATNSCSLTTNLTITTDTFTTIKSSEIVNNTNSNNLLQIPQTNIAIERIHNPSVVAGAAGLNIADNVYESESITLIDIDQPVNG